MSRYGKVDKDEEPLIEFAPTIPQSQSVIPLSEYWISHCARYHCCRIQARALRATRSKRALYDLLSPVCRVPKVFQGIKEARGFAKAGGEVVVKPDGLFSGYGVKVVGEGNLCDLESHIHSASHVFNHATRLFGVQSSDVLLCERLGGVECSADAFVWRGEAHVVRVCRKVVAAVHETPCTLVYQLIPPSEQVVRSIKLWCSVLFGADDVSFAQFDFIETAQDCLVPIDFGARVGGGIVPLLRTYYEAAAVNVWAQAIRSAAGDEAAQVEAHEGLFWTQFNCLSCKSGRLCRDDLPLPEGKQFIFKRVGEFTPRCPSSAQSVVAAAVSPHGWPVDKGTLDSLLLGEEYIASWRDDSQLARRAHHLPV